jgi:hypothetical protein
MWFLGMLVDCRCRLRAAIALHLVKIEGRNGMRTENAFECDAAIIRL